MTDTATHRSRPLDPEENEARDYLGEVKNSETAIHFYLKDDKEWWLAHTPEIDVPGRYNGPWLLWTTYPTGPWTLDYCTENVALHHVDELYYIDYHGEEAHRIHDVHCVPLTEAPRFVQEEWERGADE